MQKINSSQRKQKVVYCATCKKLGSKPGFFFLHNIYVTIFMFFENQQLI